MIQVRKVIYTNLSILFILCLCGSRSYASMVSYHEKIDSLPQVFMIGENEIEYENLVSVCNKPLLNVYQDSMDMAYRYWMSMLSDMEKYAERAEFDIKGIKIWLNVFWNPDGTIKHLVYFPKPNSRNMDFDLLTKFFARFADHWIASSDEAKCYSHYGSATFPTFAELYLEK